MAIPYEVQLAQRNLARHPWHTAAMVLGLALAVLVMVYIPSTMASFYDDLIDRAIEQNSPHITIRPQERQRGHVRRALQRERGAEAIVLFTDRTAPRRKNLNGYHALMRKVAAAPGVVAVAGYVSGNATVSRGKADLGIVLQGINPSRYAEVVNIAEHFPPEGRVPKLGPSDIAIGFRMAEDLGLHLGQHVHVATATARRLMRVKAIFRSGYYDKDLHHAYVPLSTAQRLLHLGNEISGLAVRCKSLSEAAAVSDSLRELLPQKVRNWRDDNASLLAEIATIQRVTLFIDVLIALVASVGIANVFSMFVLNRRKELAILRAVGASRVSLRSILMLEASLIWAVGTIIGCTAVLAVMAFEQSHPYEVSAETYGIGSYATYPKLSAFVAATILGAGTMALSAWWSGHKAAKLNPVEVIFGQ